MFFVSGVLFSLDRIGPPYGKYLYYGNPMAGLITNYRKILLDGELPDFPLPGRVFDCICSPVPYCRIHASQTGQILSEMGTQMKSEQVLIRAENLSITYSMGSFWNKTTYTPIEDMTFDVISGQEPRG